jgi:hypothetical protein
VKTHRPAKSEQTEKYTAGSIGGRGRHPADPDGKIFGDMHWPLPQENSHEDINRRNEMTSTLYMVIDLTTLEQSRIVAVAPMKEAQLIGKILQASYKQVVAPPLEGRGFSKLTIEQVQYIFWNMTQTPPPLEYAELLVKVKAAAEALPVDETPIHELERTVRDLYPNEPNGGIPKEPRAPKAPGEPAERPKASSTTGRVWELADVEYAKYLAKNPDGSAVDWKILRSAIVAACEAESINKATAATQYSKWRNDKSAKLAPASA